MDIIKFKKTLVFFIPFLTLSSCGIHPKRIPNQLYYFDETVKLINRYDLVKNDTNNNRFIYSVEYFEEAEIGKENSFSSLIYFYDYDNEKYNSHNFAFKVYDSYSDSYIKKDKYEFNFTNVLKREFYLYYDEIYKTLGERVFEKYSYYIVLINDDRYSNDRTKTRFD